MVEEVISNGFTDYHCHLLSSIDDGPSSFDESLQIARTLSKLGFSKIYCTPHLIKGLYDITRDQLMGKIAALQNRLNVSEINIELYPGMEYRLDEHLLEFLEEPITLSDNMILCEPQAQINPDFLLNGIYQINRRGLRPLIAHPERNHLIASNPQLTDRLLEMDCLFQGNFKSFAGTYGSLVKKRALNFLRNGLYFCVGTDSHSILNLEDDIKLGITTIMDTKPEFYTNLF